MAHALLALFLLLEEFPLPRDVATVAFGRDILSHRGDGLTCNDFGPDGSLQGDHELLPRDELFQLDADFLSEVVRVVAVNERTERIHLVAVEQDVHLDQIALLVPVGEVVE